MKDWQIKIIYAVLLVIMGTGIYIAITLHRLAEYLVP